MTNAGHALLVGVDTLNQSHFGANAPKLNSALRDVEDFERIVKLNGMTAKSLVPSNATRQNIATQLGKMAKSLKAGDYFLLFFSGFSGSVANYAGKAESPYQASWCLEDGQMLLSEIKIQLSAFPVDVDILVISDCSNGITKTSELQEPNIVQKTLKTEIADTVYIANKDFYDAVTLASLSSPDIVANTIWIHACQPNQNAHENNFNGFLTSAIKHLWKGGMYKSSFEQFFKDVVLTMPPYQSPRLEILGGNPSGMLTRKPFSIK